MAEQEIYKRKKHRRGKFTKEGWIHSNEMESHLLSEKNIRRDVYSQEAAFFSSVSQSLSIHPSLMMRWLMMMNMREGEREGERKGGRGGRRGIIPSEYMMNVVIGLKLTGGWVAHRDWDRACEWQRAPSSTLPCIRSQSLHPPPAERRRESNSRQIKKRILLFF